MPGIDYSKWDKIEVSTSDSESDGEDGSSDGRGRKPHTTKLSYPSRVVIGPNGTTVEDMPPVAEASPFRGASTTTTPNVHTPVPGSPVPGSGTTRQATQSLSSALLASGDDEAMDVIASQLTRNGGREGNSHLWSQTADRAMVSFFIPPGTKAKHVAHFAITPDAKKTNEEEGAGQAGDPLWVRACVHFDLTPDATAGVPEGFHVTKSFRYPIKLEEELLEGCWQLQNLPGGERVLVIEIFKESLGIAGMALWWDRCFDDDTLSVVDTQTIADRRDTAPRAGSGTSAFQKTWAEAHELFRARMQERRRAEQRQQQQEDE